MVMGQSHAATSFRYKLSELKGYDLTYKTPKATCDALINEINDVLDYRFYLAEKELNSARDAVLSSVGAKDSTVVFTASGSEANNLAIIGRALSKERYRNSAKIITTAGEHASVSSPFNKLADMGFEIAEIPTKNGILDLDALKKELSPKVVLVSIMMVNNETGALYDVVAASKIIKANAKIG